MQNSSGTKEMFFRQSQLYIIKVVRWFCYSFWTGNAARAASNCKYLVAFETVRKLKQLYDSSITLLNFTYKRLLTNSNALWNTCKILFTLNYFLSMYYIAMSIKMLRNSSRLLVQLLLYVSMFRCRRAGLLAKIDILQ